MNTINPFSDPEFKKKILKDEGILSDEPQELDYEILEDNSVSEVGFDNIISNAPKIPSQVKNVILDASQIAKTGKEQKAIELNKTLNEVFTRYNKEYKTDLQIDFNSLSRTLVNVADPKSRRTLELYVSEVFQSIRPVLILQMISKLTLAIEYITDPSRLLNDNLLNLPDLFVACDKILDYIGKLEDLKDQIMVKGSSLELQKLAEEQEGEIGETEEQKKMIEDFMVLFKKDNGL